MGKEIIMFDDIEIEKHKFHSYESPIFLEDVDIDSVLVSNKISSDEKNYKCFIGYLHDDYEIKPLHIMLPKTSMYVKSYDGQTKENDLFKKYNAIWDKVSAKEYDSEPVYNKTFLKTKIKSYCNEATDFHDKEMPKAGSNHTCLEVITIDSILKKR